MAEEVAGEIVMVRRRQTLLDDLDVAFQAKDLDMNRDTPADLPVPSICLCFYGDIVVVS